MTKPPPARRSSLPYRARKNLRSLVTWIVPRLQEFSALERGVWHVKEEHRSG